MWTRSNSSAGLVTAALATAAAVTISRRLLSTTALSSSRVEKLTRRRPANVGDPLDAIETPCLVVDLDAMDTNLVALPQSLRAFPHVAIRPHAKAHKCAAIGKLQLQQSKAVGLCCQKIAEAEAMFAGGIQDLLLSNEVVGHDRYARMAHLAAQGATITLLFDHAEQIKQASEVATESKIQFRALVDVNVGQNRCGVDSVDDAVALGQQIQAAPGLVLCGIQAYHGGAQHIRSYAEKSDLILNQVCTKAQQVRDAFRDNGLNCDVVTGGGTGTYLLEASSGVFTEVQPGSYLFNDADYARNLGKDGKYVRDWMQSLFVLTTVMSVNADAVRAVVDAGTKAVSLDSGVPLVKSIDHKKRTLPPLVYQGGGDEHGILCVAPRDGASQEISTSAMPSLGEKLLLTPGHCDPTVNLYDFVVGFRNGVVEHVWQVGARGPGN